MRKQAVNLWAVVVCVVLGQVIPALWYNAFSEIWVSLSGLSPEQVKSASSPVPYLASIVSTSFSMYTLAWLYTKIPVRSMLSGFITGVLIGTVFIGFEGTVKDMFAMKPLLLSVINGGSSILVYGVNGAVIGAWRKYE
ncbi:hypothetical protein DYBT9275_03304 [Dyadobacter sp. CECT 9275]|uniref:DUF1761 domain-containing protein n=1 Tax=Dyadobacter helix TaxID=2822344 RepID=A0A916JCE8_9BACT|nr:DUF1761 domain-containing protein [Dyadobacter sp. CECT 9275]CAG5004129.1 hypothetical protein DYBT9275_03304 [Dyadobacter sp. CECT 9275]